MLRRYHWWDYGDISYTADRKTVYSSNLIIDPFASPPLINYQLLSYISTVISYLTGIDGFTGQQWMQLPLKKFQKVCCYVLTEHTQSTYLNSFNIKLRNRQNTLCFNKSTYQPLNLYLHSIFCMVRSDVGNSEMYVNFRSKTTIILSNLAASRVSGDLAVRRLTA